MEVTAPPSSRKRHGGPVSPGGALVAQNGKQTGVRRPLGLPLTCIGHAAGCEVRLQGDGIQAHHCLLIHSRAGLELRDLDSPGGTFVNGSRVSTAILRDGDVLVVGEHQFRLRLPPACDHANNGAAGPTDALRVQAAAVAAQQAALGEQEGRLQQRIGALEQQEEQLSAHLEEKRRRLLQLHEKAQTERAALQNDRKSYEQYVNKVAGDLTQAQRELVENQQKVQAERRRLSELHRRLKQRWHRHWLAERQKLLIRQEELANEECNLAQQADRLEQQQEALNKDRLRFNGHYELGRRQLLSAWSKTRQAQQKWRQRRRQERAALRLRGRDLEEAEIALAEAHRHLEQEKNDRHSRRQALDKEAEGLNNRIHHQRDKIFEQQREISRLEALLRERRCQLVAPATLKPDGPNQAADGSAVHPSALAFANDAPAATLRVQDAEAQLQRRLANLDRLAGELADQRSQVAEQWQRLVQTQDRWQQDRDQAAAELEAVALRLQEQEQLLASRQQAFQAAEESLHKKHRQLVHHRQQMVGWRVRLRARASAWEEKRLHLLADVRHREQVVEQHLNNLADIRGRWAKNRRQEVDKIQADRTACENQRKEYAALRQEWQRRWTALDEEKRVFDEKKLALEQFRQETFTKSGDGPAAQRRIERLRRRWITLNADSLRALTRDREALQAELTQLEARHTEVQKRANEVTAAETSLAERRAALEHKQTLLAVEHARMKQELKTAQAQRAVTEQQLDKMKDEVERIARALLDEPDPPSLPAEKAA